MDYTEISQKSTEQLHDLLAEQREELRELKFKVAENQLADVSKIKKVKKTIARILTVLNSKVSQGTSSEEATN
ncbi:MAG: 50S ribosomal protein L29 [Candidatus Magasanikbacteria bacterium CG11_big_fil_rev_8_21_14_0_20_39_34]|uniref:Large ribosomal subunit protein uL29 n=1 Tax=Candidatus Magasanikbacteria bacterium CG11_big_fil_rev_8_21_14_0_20_39_34 TaxID=1974653 RepID=A0A2H0N3S9_9BACT|nr:MAG: 50S ribosomal protein L29 [Candidatus Magasanikbacteria bacterium CG11_big_fil_rev_8_21_14_0_20_39_34]